MRNPDLSIFHAEGQSLPALESLCSPPATKRQMWRRIGAVSFPPHKDVDRLDLSIRLSNLNSMISLVLSRSSTGRGEKMIYLALRLSIRHQRINCGCPGKNVKLYLYRRLEVWEANPNFRSVSSGKINEEPQSFFLFQERLFTSNKLIYWALTLLRASSIILWVIICRLRCDIKSVINRAAINQTVVLGSSGL